MKCFYIAGYSTLHDLEHASRQCPKWCWFTRSSRSSFRWSTGVSFDVSNQRTSRSINQMQTTRSLQCFLPMQHALNCAWICHRSRARRQSAHGNGLTVAMLRWSEIGVDDVVVEVGSLKVGIEAPGQFVLLLVVAANMQGCD